jgi:hypothetical protein
VFLAVATRRRLWRTKAPLPHETKLVLVLPEMHQRSAGGAANASVASWSVAPCNLTVHDASGRRKVLITMN